MEDNSSLIRTQIERSQFREHSAPLFLTSSFVYHSAEHAAQMFKGLEDGDIYSRFTNPNTTELVKKICQLEEVEFGVASASGMAAIYSTLATHLHAGDHLIAANSLFGNSLYIIQKILPRWKISYELLDINDTRAWETAIAKNPKMVLIETPSNPGLEIIDLEWLGKLCEGQSTLFCVDNCFATPILQKPSHFGADIIIHSATKWMDGQGRVLGGIVCGREESVQPIFEFQRRTGACLSPFNAWLLSKSLETLDVRMEKHCKNALSLAEFLETNPMISEISYPFLPSHSQFDLAKSQMKLGGGIVTCKVGNNQNECFKFINKLNLFSITANLGDTRSIVTHPATTTHSKLNKQEQLRIGITDNLIRISVGLENIIDLKNDILQALD